MWQYHKTIRWYWELGYYLLEHTNIYKLKDHSINMAEEYQSQRKLLERGEPINLPGFNKIIQEAYQKAEERWKKQEEEARTSTTVWIGDLPVW